MRVYLEDVEVIDLKLCVDLGAQSCRENQVDAEYHEPVCGHYISHHFQVLSLVLWGDECKVKGKGRHYKRCTTKKGDNDQVFLSDLPAMSLEDISGFIIASICKVVRKKVSQFIDRVL